MSDFAQAMGLSIVLMIALVIYIVGSLPVMAMARRVGHDMPWLAFIPIAQMWLLIDIAGRDWWCLLLMFVPVVNLGVSVWIGMGLADTFNQPQWLGILMLVPLVNLAVLYYFGFGANTNVLEQ